MRSWTESGSKSSEQQQAAFAERVLAEMRRKQAEYPAVPFLFSIESIGRLVGVPPMLLLPTLEQLEREGRIHRDYRTGFYTLRPWPGGEERPAAS